MITPEQALTIVKKSFVGMLKKCPGAKERYEMLDGIFPQMIFWKEEERLKFLTDLWKQEGIDAGACKHYLLENGKAYCTIESPKIECTCSIPQIYCVVRDEQIAGPRKKLERPN